MQTNCKALDYVKSLQEIVRP